MAQAGESCRAPGTRIWSIWEIPPAMEQVHRRHPYWRPCAWEPVAHKQRHRDDKPAHRSGAATTHGNQREPVRSNETKRSQK